MKKTPSFSIDEITSRQHRAQVRAGLRKQCGLEPETSRVYVPTQLEFVHERLREQVHGKSWWANP
jgi:hypothetical protein